MLFHWEQQRMSPSLWGNCLLGFVLQQMKEPVCLLSRLTRICFVELLCHTLTVVLTFVIIQRNNTKGPLQKKHSFQGFDFKSVPVTENTTREKKKFSVVWLRLCGPKPWPRLSGASDSIIAFQPFSLSISLSLSLLSKTVCPQSSETEPGRENESERARVVVYGTASCQTNRILCLGRPRIVSSNQIHIRITTGGRCGNRG